MSIKLRSNSLKIWLYTLVISSCILVFRYSLSRDWFLIITIISSLPVGLNIISTSLLLINMTNNKSPGAIDNGSGLVMVLEILNNFKELNYIPENYSIWFVFTGAEECGTMGIRNFYNTIMKDFNRDNTFIINFDAIGRDLVIWAALQENEPKERPVLEFFEQTKVLNPQLILKTGRLQYTRSDGYFLKTKNFRGIGFGDLVAYKHIHSVNDTPDKCDIKLFENTCKFLTELIIKLDKYY